jgi:hypothetical protein
MEITCIEVNVRPCVKNPGLKPGVMVHTCNRTTQEAESGGSRIFSQPGRQSEVRPCLKTNKVARHQRLTHVILATQEAGIMVQS